MRSLRRGAAVAFLGTVLGAALLTSPAGARTPDRSSRKTATEVCEEMVRAAVAASAQQPVPDPEPGVWAGQSYSCTYAVGAGSLVLRVDVLADRPAAKAAYRQTRDASDVEQVFNGIGQAAFQAANGSIVARKDRFLLTSDPSLLPADLSKKDLSFAAVSAVLTCWTGET